LWIDRIEFLKGPSAAIYGVRGANGVIAIYTKSGEFMKRGEIDFTLVGYQKPEKFFIKVDTNSQEEIKLPGTILWIPEVSKTSQASGLIKIKKAVQAKYVLISITGTTINGESINRVVRYEIR
jgi:TonB-dependent SusC/RagA subfamily outer membrane receptor